MVVSWNQFNLQINTKLLYKLLHEEGSFCDLHRDEGHNLVQVINYVCACVCWYVTKARWNILGRKAASSNKDKKFVNLWIKKINIFTYFDKMFPLLISALVFSTWLQENGVPFRTDFLLSSEHLWWSQWFMCSRVLLSKYLHQTPFKHDMNSVKHIMRIVHLLCWWYWTE